jgi:hypothetical protein
MYEEDRTQMKKIARKRETAEEDPSTRLSTLFATTGGILCQLRTGSCTEGKRGLNTCMGKKDAYKERGKR